MKKTVETIGWIFMFIFVLGVLVTICGIGEFDDTLMLIGGLCTIVGFMLSVICFVAWDSIESKSRK